LFQPELFVRSTKASLGDVLADPGTTMRATATEMVVPTVAQQCLSMLIEICSNLPLIVAVKSDNFASTREPEGHTTACDSKSAIMIPKVGAGPRMILPSEPTAIPVAIIWALSL